MICSILFLQGGDKVFEWRKTIQAMVDIIEKQLYNNFDEETTDLIGKGTRVFKIPYILGIEY